MQLIVNANHRFPGENIAMAGARMLGLNKLVKSIIAIPHSSPPPPPPPPPFTRLAGLALPPFATPIAPNRKSTTLPSRAVAAAPASTAQSTEVTAANDQISENGEADLTSPTSTASDIQSAGTALKRTAHSENFSGQQDGKSNDTPVNDSSAENSRQSSVHIIEKPRKLPATSSMQLVVPKPEKQQPQNSEPKVLLLKESKNKMPPQLDATQTQPVPQPPPPEEEAPQSKVPQSKDPEQKDPRTEES